MCYLGIRKAIECALNIFFRRKNIFDVTRPEDLFEVKYFRNFLPTTSINVSNKSLLPQLITLEKENSLRFLNFHTKFKFLT